MLGTPALKDELSKRFCIHTFYLCVCVSKPVLVNLIHMGESLYVNVGQVSCVNLKSYCSIYWEQQYLCRNDPPDERDQPGRPEGNQVRRCWDDRRSCQVKQWWYISWKFELQVYQRYGKHECYQHSERPCSTSFREKRT